MIAGDEEKLRAEVRRRLSAWREEGVPPRKYALLLAHYYDRHYPPPGRGLVRWVAVSADRPLTGEEWASAAECAGRDYSWAMQLPITNYPVTEAVWTRLTRPILHLESALTDPVRAAEQLVGSAHWNALLADVMECLRPEVWERPAPDWTPPPEAVAWARRIYEAGVPGELPVLADLLEDADCPDRPLLDHCRTRDRHHRGSAALDRILGIERQETAPHLRLAGLNEGHEGRGWWFSDPFEVGVAGGRFLAARRPTSVSRRHASVSRDGTGWRVADLGSTNGTYLNGTRLGAEPAGPLRAGDVVQFAAVAFRVVSATPGV